MNGGAVLLSEGAEVWNSSCILEFSGGGGDRGGILFSIFWFFSRFVLAGDLDSLGEPSGAV